jgi:hypothetical protein
MLADIDLYNRLSNEPALPTRRSQMGSIEEVRYYGLIF